MIRTRGTMALAVRSLREDARLVRSYGMRLLMVGLLFFMLFQTQRMSQWMGAPGLQLFQQVCIVNALFICLAGISFFSSVISEEKEDMTLGLLRMTDLNPVSILLGKAGSRIVGGVILILTQLPFTLLSITLGGVSFGQIIAAFAALLAFMFALANLAMLVSVIVTRTRSAAGIMFLLMLVFFIGPHILQAWLRSQWLVGRALVIPGAPGGPWWLATMEKFAEGCIAASPFSRINQISLTGFNESPGCFQVYVSLAAGAAFFLLSWLVFNRFNAQEHAPNPGPGRLGAGSRRWMARRRKRGRRAWRFAVVWKDFIFTTGGRAGFVARMIVYAVIAGLTRWSFGRLDPQDTPSLPDILLSIGWIGMACELLVIASRVFHEEVRWRTLSTLVLLPTSVARLAYTKVAGCLVSLAPLVIVFTLGAALDRQEFAHYFDYYTGEKWFWFCVLDYIMALHLAALLSIHLKWGAIAAAATIILVGHMLAGGCVDLLNVREDPAWWLFTALVLCLTALFHVATLGSLKKSAAQG